jgi:large subunit ribosomal protein L32e
MEKKSNNNALDARKLLKSKKPTFLRQDGHKKIRLGNKWRKPKGLQNKMRLNKRGYRKSVSVGYKSPRLVKGFDKSGLEIINITKIDLLESVDPKTQGIVISGNIGQKKKIEIVKIAIKKSITILNIKDPEKYITDINEKLSKKKEQKDKSKKVKNKKEEEKKKLAKEKEEKDKKAKEEEKKKTDDKSIEKIAKETKTKETKEKEKLLIQKNAN